MQIKVFTHGSDSDGLGCAFLTQIAYGKDNVDIQYVEYHNINKAVYNFIINKEVNLYDKIYITDISLSPKMCEWIDRDYFGKFKIIDHHINDGTNHLKQYSWCIREGEKENGDLCSATWLVAREFDLLGTNSFLDDIVTGIDRYDTWLWKTKYNDYKPSKNLADLFYLIGRDTLLEEIFKQYKNKNEKFVLDEKMTFVLELKNKEYERHLEYSNKYMKKIKWKDYIIGILFNDKFTSELGNDLCKLHEDIDFVAMINFKTGISLRSIKDGIHLGNVAKEIGEQIGLNGGGHMKASSVTFNDDIRNEIMLFLIKGSELWNIGDDKCL